METQGLAGKLQAQDKTMDAVDANVKALVGDVKAVERNVKVLDKKVGALDGKMDGKMDTLGKDVAAMNRRMDKIEGLLETILAKIG